FVARHILIMVPPGSTPAKQDSLRKKAEGIRGQVTTANFADMAKRYSNDSASGRRGGDLGAFRREEMVKPFADAVAALKPGEISPLVETQFGYHIIQRPTYAQARAEYDQAYRQIAAQVAESIYVAKVDAGANISV